MNLDIANVMKVTLFNRKNGQFVSRTVTQSADGLVRIQPNTKIAGNFAINFQYNFADYVNFTITNGAFNASISQAVLSSTAVNAGTTVTISIAPLDQAGNSISLSQLSLADFNYTLSGKLGLSSNIVFNTVSNLVIITQ